jgi:hypothetical protein
VTVSSASILTIYKGVDGMMGIKSAGPVAFPFAVLSLFCIFYVQHTASLSKYSLPLFVNRTYQSCGMPTFRFANTATGLPNWVIGCALCACVAGTYYYTVLQVGSTDIDAVVEKEVKKQTGQ